MKAIIDGKRYDTSTAAKICDVSPRGFSRGDYQYEDTYLYRTPNGRWFLSGEGGPLSRWAQSEGQSGKTDGKGIQALTEYEARTLLEQHREIEALEQYFGDMIEDA